MLATTIFLCLAVSAVMAQSQDAPLTSQELVKLVYQLPKQPEKKEQVIEEIRRRGLGFALTDGMRSLAASKSGNDALLRRTLEEAERRRMNPKTSALLPEKEAQELLEKARAATSAAVESMPDFVVKQQISRSYSRGGIGNWLFRDRLLLAVSYRSQGGEEYKLLAVNGLPPQKDMKPFETYADLFGGASSSGEYVTMLAKLFDEEQRPTFKAVDTDVLRGRRTIIYEYQIPIEFAQMSLTLNGQTFRAGYHGKIWIDRETYRVLRFEEILDAPADAPGDASIIVDYDWATIADQRYLLPSQSETRINFRTPDLTRTERALIRYRSYQKYGSEVKVIEEDIVEDMPADKP